MDMHASTNYSPNMASSEDEELRRGPWTVEEDLLLMNYISVHGEGRWNSLARSAGLKRTGKSCRLRWLNYLRPDVRRGNITPEEQLLILELHSRWGNRWSKIAQHLPGRTDNEIKNYWRTRVQKHAKQLRCDVNSKKFKDIMRYLWMPRLVERIQARNMTPLPSSPNPSLVQTTEEDAGAKQSPEASSESSPPVSENFVEGYCCGGENWGGMDNCEEFSESWFESLSSPGASTGLMLPEFDRSGEWGENLWSVEDIWLQQ